MSGSSNPALLDEIVLGDLVRECHYTVDQVCQMGYYEAFRLWTIIDELRARDLSHLANIFDYANTNEEYRGKVRDWLEGRQPRGVQAPSRIPQDVLEKFAKEFNDG